MKLNKRLTIIITLAFTSFSCNSSDAHNITEYFDNGNTKSISIFKGDSRIQKIEFSDDGNILSRSFYENDCLFAKWISGDLFLPSGLVSNYYGNGNLKSQGHIINDVMHGHWSHYYRDGNLESDRYYFNGQPTGDWYSYYNGNTDIEHHGFIKGNGSWIEYYNADLNIKGENRLVKKEISFFNDNQITGNYEFYYKDGTIKISGFYSGGKKDGEWNYYNEQGKLIKIENYKEGQLDGDFKLFFSDGITEKLIGSYKNNKRSDHWFWYFDQDKKSNHKISYSK